MKLNDGERVVGIRYPQILIPEVETALKEQRFIEKVQQNVRNSLLFAMLSSFKVTFFKQHSKHS